VVQSVEPADLTRDGCLRLLGAATVGRIVFTEAAMPAVEPVGYRLDGEEVVFHVAHGGTLAVATKNAVVGFQVDSIDLETDTGWSVLGIGKAYEVVDPDRLARGRAGTRLVVAVPMERLSGHRLRLSR
jgi:nitroimidazol reductase NimA-like FMN-containing flavoprotein (pyridoxamine 5'-phosphate oxidase superfamily)